MYSNMRYLSLHIYIIRFFTILNIKITKKIIKYASTVITRK